MLLQLNIRDFVIVDHLELEFRPGFTVLTGETGAGKSILIDALSLVLGERADAGVVRANAARAEIEAEFDSHALPQLQSWLDENDLGGDPGICLMRRVVDAGGRSRGFINGRSATLQQLREAGEFLVDIHGQHAHQSMLKTAAQRELLDAYAGQGRLVKETTVAWRDWQALRRARLEREKNAAAYAEELERLEWQAKELATLNFSLQEWEELQAEHGRLSNAASLVEGAQYGLEVLSESEMACLAQANGVIARLNNLVEYDAGLREVLDLLVPAEVQMSEAVYGLRHYLQRLDIDPERLAQCEQRLGEIHDTARKYRVGPEQLPELLAEKNARLSELSGFGTGGDETRREATAQAHYLDLAGKLSAARKTAAQELGEKVSVAMQTLAMAGGRFEIALTACDGSPHGLEEIEFQVSAHSGLSPKPLAKVASGGELSRISLAIQVITSKVSLVPTLIFDEVDVGIGGGVAEIVGQLLKKLGAERQVLCVTHLPQVAAQGDHHWQVSKDMRDGSVVSHIRVLDRDVRIEEVARMLGGVEVTDTTRKHAAEMLGM
ncbi:MAG: DNA repair protein RecN [Betaproteobacteria bacterium]|nr:DNA repair protein RecN [Betaproteobacteria bacterium]